MYRCREEGCNVSYNKNCHLERHERKHTGERPFVCDVQDCDKSYTEVGHLKRHKCFVHERSDEISCTVKGCGQVFNNRYSLKKHINKHHSENKNLFVCAHCSQEFKKKRQLKQHLLSHKGNDALKCSLCNISFESLHLYNKHKRNHKTYTCDCGSTFDKWTIFCKHRRESCTVQKVDHKCIICNKVFTTKSNLKIHSLCHVEESQMEIYHCPFLDCYRSYKYKKNLNCHISTYHEKNSASVRINCTEEGCQAVLNSKKNLRQHIVNMHSGQPKKTKKRRPRRDKGKRKKCMASVMSGVSLPHREHIAIINASNNTNNTASQIERPDTSENTVNKNKFDGDSEAVTANQCTSQEIAENSAAHDFTTEILIPGDETRNKKQFCQTVKCF